jgi:hypothetical protein
MDIEDIRRKAEAGGCVAQSILGLSYLYGYDVGVDYKKPSGSSPLLLARALRVLS